jgi:anti-sigma regulatory factor (Ser/Thr protein kinase)
MRAEPLPSSSRRVQALVLGGWLALGLLESAKTYLDLRLSRQSPSWTAALTGDMPWWLAWAALTPLVVAAARHWRLDSGGLRVFAAHTLGSVLVATAHNLVVGTIFYFTTSQGTEVGYRGEFYPMTLAIQLRMLFLGYFVVNVLTYWAIAGGYYALEYYRRTREGEMRAVRLEADLHQARLEALRMELNPHFLFNTLNTVASLVEQQRYDGAVRMLARLGDLLRTTLDHADDQQIVLTRELEFLEIYLEIVRTRFCDRLTVDLAIDRDTRAALVPTLILQPLVENAVRHGVAQRTGPGRITVSARHSDGRLELSVTDRAEGAAVVEGAGHDRPGNGIGLANTRRRLEQLYGGAGSVRLEPLGDGRGSLVTVSLPFATGQAV